MEGGHGDDATLQKSLKTHNGDKNESIHYVEKENYWNRLNEAYRCLCLSISRDLLFHINGLKTPKEVWDKLASLFEKRDDLRIYHLENESISLHPINFKTLNDFFTKFKQLVFQLKLCKVEKEDNQLILDILSKLGANYSVFLFVNIMNRLYLYLHCESEEYFGVKLHLHVLLPLVVVERSEKLHWRGHFEYSEGD